jgi:hypothetical protein
MFDKGQNAMCNSSSKSPAIPVVTCLAAPDSSVMVIGLNLIKILKRLDFYSTADRYAVFIGLKYLSYFEENITPLLGPRLASSREELAPAVSCSSSKHQALRFDLLST